MSMLKFRLSYEPGTTEYLAGALYFQPYAPLTSTETCLITNTTDAITYDNTEYEEQMCYFNHAIRTKGYDKKCEEHILEQYINSEHNHNDVDEDILKLQINCCIRENFHLIYRPLGTPRLKSGELRYKRVHIDEKRY